MAFGLAVSLSFPGWLQVIVWTWDHKGKHHHSPGITCMALRPESHAGNPWAVVVLPLGKSPRIHGAAPNHRKAHGTAISPETGFIPVGDWPLSDLTRPNRVLAGPV